MNSLKVLGLVTAATCLILAVTAVGSASAVTMCQVKGVEALCPVGKRYIAREYNTTIPLEATFAIFNGGKEVNQNHCKESGVIWKTTKESASPLPGEVTTLLASDCTFCKQNEFVNLPYSASITGTGSADGVMTVTNGGKGDPRFVQKGCALNTTCEWGADAGKMKFSITGGSPAVVTVAAAKLQYSAGSGEFVCGEWLEMSANYNVLQPATLFVTAGP